MTVAVRGLSVRYPHRADASLRDLDLELRPGERVLVLGPSGSGKSSLLRVLAGVVPQSVTADVTGSVRVAGRDVADVPVPELSRDAGLLLQDPASQLCLPRVDEEVAFPLENRAVPPAAIGSGVGRALARSGATGLRERPTLALSGGEQQRVALAATLAAEPPLLLLDEPTALLDPAAAAGLGEVLLGRSEDAYRPTVVLVEHRLDELPVLPERLLVLDGAGRVTAQGGTHALLREHATALADAGVWLPLGTELAVAAGRHEVATATPRTALADAAVASSLRTLGRRTPPPPAVRGTVALHARDAAFAVDGTRAGCAVRTGAELALRAGEVTAVIGCNGRGKTTLLLGLAGLTRRVSGAVEGGPAGMVFQQPEHQFLGRSVVAEIGYGLDGFGVHGQQRRARVDAALTEFGLSHLADADPFRLSGGEKRRLSVAAMAVLDHPVLLLDEPTFGQDRAHALTLADHLRATADAGRAVAFATHDLRLVGLVADRVVVVHGGRVTAAGPTHEMLADARLLAAAGLVRPPLLDWWAEQSGVGLRPLLQGLREALT
ncbi:MAG: ATP-binding cassette domain-containing protein [Streptosporangiales bacterium]|nr:ATP-binding cassette domain-containing protein [Streptosporangiales bacterium]